MAGVVRVHEVGGPEVLRFEDIEVGSPGPGQALVRQTAVGLNYIDVYFRSGLYPTPSLPFVAGQEGAGVVEAVGDGVSEVRAGQRVAYAGPLGAYAERRLIPADRLVPLPEAWLRLAGRLLGRQAAVERLCGSLQVDSGAIREAGSSRSMSTRSGWWSEAISALSTLTQRTREPSIEPTKQ